MVVPAENAPDTAADATARLATLAGFSAILMWALLAILTDLTGRIPPFQLAAMTFLIGTAVGLVWQTSSPGKYRKVRTGWKTLAFGGIGLFAYHALYFAALKAAPAVEASLIAYLWPLLIVTGSALLPGEKLRWHHVLGVLAGFAGTALIVTGGEGFALKQEHAGGYLLALAAAFTWATYSLASRRLQAVPTSAVTIYCAITTALAVVAHLLFEQTVWPQGATQWLAVAGLGLLPVGAAFYVWDHGMKRGNIQVLGAASYAAPLLSTLILLAFGRAQPGIALFAACILITAGAFIASKDMLKSRR